MDMREALVEMAVQRGAELPLAHAALYDTDRKAVMLLLDQVEKADDANFIVRKYIEEIIRRADENGNLITIAKLLLNKHHDMRLTDLVAHLSGSGNRGEAIDLLRKIIHLDWATEDARRLAAVGIFVSLYARQIAALNDPAPLVRIVATHHFEQTQNTQALITALYNVVTEVRHIAVWYMGQRKVSRAVDALCDVLANEQDVETSRGAIWAVGVLKANEARPHLENLLQHENPMIITQAQTALNSLH